MSATVTPIRRDYTSTEKDAALVAFILCSGHVERTEELLRQEGFDIPGTTIHGWATKTEVERFERLRREWEPRVIDKFAFVHEGLLTLNAEAETLALSKAIDRINADTEDKIPLKDLAAIHRSASVGTGIHSEKQLLYSGRPTQIVKREPAEIERRLREQFGVAFTPVAGRNRPGLEAPSEG